MIILSAVVKRKEICEMPLLLEEVEIQEKNENTLKSFQAIIDLNKEEQSLC